METDDLLKERPRRLRVETDDLLRRDHGDW